MNTAKYFSFISCWTIGWLIDWLEFTDLLQLIIDHIDWLIDWLIEQYCSTLFIFVVDRF